MDGRTLPASSPPIAARRAVGDVIRRAGQRWAVARLGHVPLAFRPTVPILVSHVHLPLQTRRRSERCSRGESRVSLQSLPPAGHSHSNTDRHTDRNPRGRTQTYIHTDVHTQTYTHGHTCTHADRHTDRHTDTLTHMHIEGDGCVVPAWSMRWWIRPSAPAPPAGSPAGAAGVTRVSCSGLLACGRDGR